MTTKSELEDALRERDRRIADLQAENARKAELEDALRERDRRIAELQAENDKQADLIGRQREKLNEAGDVEERSATAAERAQTGQLLEIIQANPGLTAVEIHRALAERSWAAQRFGKWATMFGPTYGAMYVALAQLARDGSVDVNRGEATAERRQGGRRPLRFYARRTHATEPS
jgi:DNA repair exonuclease SbcCD ATPase subunit